MSVTNSLRATLCGLLAQAEARRSEEHTSELQSHLNLVCRLLLEKKKNTRGTDAGSGRLSTTLGITSACKVCAEGDAAPRVMRAPTRRSMMTTLPVYPRGGDWLM